MTSNIYLSYHLGAECQLCLSICLLVVYVYSTLYTKVEKLPGVLERSHFLSDSEEKIKKREDNGRTRLVEEYVFNVAARGR